MKNFTRRVMDIIGNMYPIVDKEIERYVNRILEDFTDEHFADFSNNEYTYTDKIKNKICSLSEQYAEKKFREYLDTDKIFIKTSYTLPQQIVPGKQPGKFPKHYTKKKAK